MLLIDDNADVRETTSALLRTAQYVVVGAKNGPEALALLAQRSFDIVLTELVLPSMSGLEVAREVKTQYPGTAVILPTGWGDISDVVSGRDDPVTLILPKSVRFQRLLMAIREAIGPGMVDPNDSALR